MTGGSVIFRGWYGAVQWLVDQKPSRMVGWSDGAIYPKQRVYSQYSGLWGCGCGYGCRLEVVGGIIGRQVVAMVMVMVM